MTNFNPADRCESCVFFGGVIYDDKGECHRFPPQVTALWDQRLNQKRPYTQWPTVGRWEWCGEHHKPKAAP